MGINRNTELFTDKSESYAKYRAGYPSELINEILKPFSGLKDVTIADIGAGTGISSRLMAEKGAQVIAVEPNKAMAEAADDHPNINFRIAPAENTSLHDSSVEMVTSFQSFHWFNFKESLKEFKRIIKPNGRLALVWSYWDETDPFTAKYLDIITQATNKNKEHVSPYDGFPSGFIKKWRIRFLWKFRSLPNFKNVKRIRYRYEQEMNLEGLIGCAHSQSYLIHEGPEWDLLCDKIQELVRKQDEGSIILKYKVNLFLAIPRK